LVGQIGQNGEGDVVLSKLLSLLPEAELPEPVRNLLHPRPPHRFAAANDRIQSLLIIAATLQSVPRQL